MREPESAQPKPTHAAVRAIEVADPGPRPQRFKPVAPHVEVSVSPPAALPFRAVVPAADATLERVNALIAKAPALPRLEVGPGHGAIDVTLQSARGVTLKVGSLILTRRRESIRVPRDPATRRFRAGNIPAGRWEVRAVAAGFGQAQQAITVREQDVVRCAVRLDGRPATGRVRVRFRLGGPARRVRVVARDRVSGRPCSSGRSRSPVAG
jgi:hypothetical protein